MRIQVDLAACEGHGLCAQVAPGVFQLDEDGYVQLLLSDIPPETEGAAVAGARVCPVGALRVVA